MARNKIAGNFSPIRDYNIRGKAQEQVKNIMYQEIAEFITEKMISYEILVKVALNLQEEVKRLKKDNKKLEEVLYEQKELDSKFISLERDFNTFLSISQDKKYQSQSLQKKQKEIGNKIEKMGESQRKLKLQMEIRESKSDPMMIEEEIIQKPLKNRGRQILRQNVSIVEVHAILSEIQKFQQKKQNYGFNKKRRNKREEVRLNQIYCSPNGQIYKISKEMIRQEQENKRRKA